MSRLACFESLIGKGDRGKRKLYGPALVLSGCSTRRHWGRSAISLSTFMYVGYPTFCVIYVSALLSMSPRE